MTRTVLLVVLAGCADVAALETPRVPRPQTAESHEADVRAAEAAQAEDVRRSRDESARRDLAADEMDRAERERQAATQRAEADAKARKTAAELAVLETDCVTDRAARLAYAAREAEATGRADAVVAWREHHCETTDTRHMVAVTTRTSATTTETELREKGGVRETCERMPADIARMSKDPTFPVDDRLHDRNAACVPADLAAANRQAP